MRKPFVLTTCNHSYVHEIIQFCIDEFSDSKSKIKEYYGKGHSLYEVAAMVGLPYSTVRDRLVAQGVTLRTNKSVSASVVFRDGFKSSAPPPFGYCYLEGRLQKHPHEYPTLQIIQEQRRQGKKPVDIARYLNSRNLKTKTGKSWKQPAVFKIFQRLDQIRKEVQE